MQNPSVSADLVLIEWEDSRRPDAEWKHLVGGHEWTQVKCASVGWLMLDNDQIKVLAPNMGDIDDASNMQLSGEIVIPTSCVLSIVRLIEIPRS